MIVRLVPKHIQDHNSKYIDIENQTGLLLYQHTDIFPYKAKYQIRIDFPIDEWKIYL